MKLWTEIYVIIIGASNLYVIETNHYNKKENENMNFSEIVPYLFTIGTGLLSWCGSYIMASRKSKQEMNSLRISNQHDLEKLMNQHKLDLDSLREQQKLELEKIEKEHQHKLELLQLQHENEMQRKEKELEDSAKFGTMKDIMGGVLGGIMNNAINSPEMQEEISKRIREGLKENKNK